MGDATSGPVRLSFNSQLRVEFRGATVTSDAGLLLPRELDERLGLEALIERHLTDPRTGHNRQFPLPDLLRQSLYSRLVGYEDTNDAERLAEDPTSRMLASRERRETSVALTSTLHWFETEVLAEERNFQGLARLNTDLVQHEAIRPPTRRVTLDIDTNRAVVRFYNERGTAEQWIKEGKEATHWTRLSCHRFRANEVRLLLGVIAYTLGNLLRRLVLPLAIQSWSLTSLQQCLLKTGGRLMRHAPVLHPTARRKLLDTAPVPADRGAHRATRVAPHVIDLRRRAASSGTETTQVSLTRTPSGRSILKIPVEKPVRTPALLDAVRRALAST